MDNTAVNNTTPMQYSRGLCATLALVGAAAPTDLIQLLLALILHRVCTPQT
ncbi:hypothetical protein BDA96_09G269100 [Sorghum bicolor]|uniref:Uncharacterized protein n=2 Tax=Sorghum bicolor TaxID=4558 RepID=A0A1B6PB70_SORBI|nr:hypothetical protein BDA96_09G269100 [Sorghum bicolor]KXG22665.1 hypothetical protein SORBI_3009G253900 [Sorghum bicolor]